MAEPSRRDFLGTAAIIGGWAALGSATLAQDNVTDPSPVPSSPGGPYTLPPLPYDYADLEPHIDAQTMKLHHDVHHAGYVRGANAAIAGLEAVRRVGGEQIREVRTLSDKLSFNLSGHLLHSVFWTSMSKEGGGPPPPGGEAARMIKRDFGSIAAFSGQFQAAAQQVQGSGWALLAYEPLAQRLLVIQAEKHQNLGVPGCVPLLAIDVWEHAYYLNYQNKRSSYIKAFMNVINWQNVEQRLQAATKT